MSEHTPILWWVRRDLRLSDNPALDAACKAGGPVLPVFVHDDSVAGLGAAPKWRLGLGLGALDAALRDRGSRLILRRGPAREVMEALIDETGARAVHWTRLYDPEARERDERIKSAFKQRGIAARSFGGHLLFEPWDVATQDGAPYRVFTPMWRAVKGRAVATPLATPGRIPAPESWPAGEALDDWAMGAAMDRGAEVVRPHVQLGEGAAQGRLGAFMAHGIDDYAEARNRPAEDGTSKLSENLALGEISPHQCWHAGLRARSAGKAGAETFLRELVWREFACHLMYHTPRILTDNWRPEWDAFPWNEDERRADVKAWKQARTGVPFVDAAMREMQVTGRMHNRGRMVVASYLTKHLMCHWRIGQRWFEQHLIDWDAASNAMGWQWAAGSGPDAAPYFRIFNPATQLDRFDPQRRYPAMWIAEGQSAPPRTALDYFRAIPRRWSMAPDDPRPDPVVALDEGRQRALKAYQDRDW